MTLHSDVLAGRPANRRIRPRALWRRAPLVGAAALATTATMLLPGATPASGVITAAPSEFRCNHRYERYVVPSGATKITIDAVGGHGETPNLDTGGGGAGGKGGRAVATFTVHGGERLTVVVGCPGEPRRGGFGAGYGGVGGSGGRGIFSPGGSGGGSSRVTLDKTILVEAGGGGGGGGVASGAGGPGGDGGLPPGSGGPGNVSGNDGIGVGGVGGAGGQSRTENGTAGDTDSRLHGGGGGGGGGGHNGGLGGGAGSSHNPNGFEGGGGGGGGGGASYIDPSRTSATFSAGSDSGSVVITPL